MQADMFNADKGRTVGMIRSAGFGWLKQQIRWETWEPSRGNINWGGLDDVVNNAQAQGAKVLFSVVTTPGWARADGRHDGPPDNYADFANFVAQLAARYKGRVQAYEIWNEQNFSREWGGGSINAGQYVELLKATYPKVKAADPNAIVISGALTPTGVNNASIAVDDVVYLDQMYAYNNGEIKNYCDAIGAHAAGFGNGPEDWVGSVSTTAPSHNNHGSFFFKRIDELHNIMAKYGDTKQMWITEYHWASATAPVPAGYEWTTYLTEAQAATFMVQGYQMMQQRSWVGAAFVWNLNWQTFANPHTDECALFGILNADWSPRPMYSALAAMPKPNAQ
jgi:hypothetical protein